jgi:hypothetical protein
MHSRLTEGPEMPESAPLALVPPTNEKFTVRLPRRKPNAEYRSREHLTEQEVERLFYAQLSSRPLTVAFPSALVAPELDRLKVFG